MTTLEVFLSILAIILIIATASIVLVVVSNLVISIIDKKNAEKNGKQADEDEPKLEKKKKKDVEKELYFKEENVPVEVKKEEITAKNGINYEFAELEEQELAKLHREEEEVKNGKFARKTFEEISTNNIKNEEVFSGSFFANENKEDEIANILKKYEDVEETKSDFDFDAFLNAQEDDKEADVFNVIDNTATIAEEEKDRISELADEIASLKKEIRKEKDSDEKEKLKFELNEIVKTREELVETIALATKDHEQFMKEKAEKEEELKNKAQEIEKLKAELELAKLNKSDEVEILKLKAELKEAKNYKPQNEEVEQLKQQLEELKNEKDKVESEVINSLKEELERYKTASNQTIVVSTNSKEDIENRIIVLEDRLKENEKDFKKIKKEYIPLDRVRKTLENDIMKLRRKEAIVAKHNVILYGVNNYVDIDDEKAKKLTEEHELLDGLRMSVKKCEEVIAKNKDRLPSLEQAYNILKANNDTLREDIAELQQQLSEI